MWDTLSTYFWGLRIQKTHLGTFQIISVARSDQHSEPVFVDVMDFNKIYKVHMVARYLLHGC